MFKPVVGNMFLCVSSGQAHVCDQNCTQRIALDSHTEVCRLSRRTFARQCAPMSEAAPRKRSAHDLQQHQQQQQQPGGGLAVGQPPKRLQPSADYALQASSGAAWAHAPLHAWPTN